MPKQARSATVQRRPQVVTSQHRLATSWSTHDDETLMTARAQGLNWQPIASRHFPSKTANACRKRHERLMERRNAEDWDGVKLEQLAVAYMEVRRDMWSVLASRIGEKWQLLENKCMEKGLKNLHAAYRAAHRRDRGTPQDGDDSGIGFSDAEVDADDNSVEDLQHCGQNFPATLPSLPRDIFQVGTGSTAMDTLAATAVAQERHQRVPSIQSMLGPADRI